MTRLTLKQFSVLNLKPFNLNVNDEIVCLSGASGAGKSLLLRAIADLDEHKGEASLDNIACYDTSPVLWRQKVGLLPAESAWWMDKVGDHFSNPSHEHFAQLGLSLESLNWDVTRCSTGEKQRLAILRLLMQQPKALLLDEATASLDSENILKVESLIKSYSETNRVPVLWVSHDQEQIKRIARRKLILDKTELKEVSV